MSEFIIIQVGQCGNQIGNVLLPGILQEYDISTNNCESSKNERKNRTKLQQYLSSFFNIEPNSKIYDSLSDLTKSNVKARIICIDMEDSVVAHFKTSQFRDLYDKKCFITNYSGSGNNWAQGYCEHGSNYKERILNAVKFNAEHCDNLHGFLLLFSAGGGTGSGLGTFIVKLLADHYPLVDRFVVCVYPTGTEDVITCPYNVALATQELLNHATCVFPVENRTLLEIVLKQANPYNSKNFKHVSGCEGFEDMNNVIVNMILHFTSGSRFAGSLNIDMNEISTNMLPFPDLNFLSSGFSPLAINGIDSRSSSKQLRNEHFLSSCSRKNQLIKIDPLDPQHISFSTTLLGRGSYSMSDLRSYIDKLQDKLHFAPWSQKTIKVGLCDVAPKGANYAMFSLFNTTAMSGLYETILSQFMKLYQRKAHVHHYTEINGFEFEDFTLCQNSLHNAIQAYSDMSNVKSVSTHICM